MFIVVECDHIRGVAPCSIIIYVVWLLNNFYRIVGIIVVCGH